MRNSTSGSKSIMKLRWPEIRARPFDRDGDTPTNIENMLSRKQQSKLRDIATALEYKGDGSTIFSEGEEAQFVYSVVAGVVRIARHSDSGRRQVLAFMLPGDLFGIPDAGLYANSAETVCPTTLYRVPWQTLRELMLREPEMQINLLGRVAFDLREAQRRIIILGQHNISQRLASFLLEFINHPDFYDARQRALTLPLSRFDLADYLGTAPETVARAFTKLERDGLVHRITSRLIEICDIDALQGMVGGRRRGFPPPQKK